MVTSVGGSGMWRAFLVSNAARVNPIPPRRPTAELLTFSFHFNNNASRREFINASRMRQDLPLAPSTSSGIRVGEADRRSAKEGAEDEGVAKRTRRLRPQVGERGA